jgi:putative holliday junction resolvase
VRVIGLDLGSRRIGVATSDRSGTLASPLTVLDRTKDTQRLYRQIRDLVVEEEAEMVIVGLPLSLDGSMGPAALAAVAEAEALASVVGVPVETFDERLTTVTAHQNLQMLEMRAQARRRIVDKVAAAVMLQTWLDTRRAKAERGEP